MARDCLASLLDDVIYPALRWQAGRTAMAIRASATSALLSLVAAKIGSRLIGLFQDDCQKTRKMALQAMGKILHCLGNDSLATTDNSIRTNSCLEDKLLGSLAAELKERLEDDHVEVMLEAVQCSLRYLTYVRENEAEDIRTESLADRLILHMDSDSPEVRQLVLESLLQLPSWWAARLRPKVVKAALTHSHKMEVNQLEQHLNNLRPMEDSREE